MLTPCFKQAVIIGSSSILAKRVEMNEMLEAHVTWVGPKQATPQRCILEHLYKLKKALPNKGLQRNSTLQMFTNTETKSKLLLSLVPSIASELSCVI